MSSSFYSSSAKPLPPIRYEETAGLRSEYEGKLDVKPKFVSAASSTESLQAIAAEKESSWLDILKLASWRQGSMQHRNHGVWKPITFSGPILSCFIIFSMLVIVLLEILSRKSATPENGGGLIFAEDIEAFAFSSSFIFLYLPIVVAVIYSMLWSWIDLDAKRLEPWFQLSKTEGSRAKDSLLLQYPFDFLPLVPFKAFRRRHWGVFSSGTIMLIIFWIITPLQPAIFNTGTVTRTFTMDMVQTGSLIPLATQFGKMNTNLLNRAYGISWLSQAPAPYTTREFATLPFRPVNTSRTALPSEVWETTTEAYTTNITCKSIEPVYIPNEGMGYQFNNGEGCRSAFAIPGLSDIPSDPNDYYPPQKYLLMYIGWDSDAHVSYSFGNPNCTEEFRNQYLAIFGTGRIPSLGSGQYEDIQIMFCTPSYTIQEMAVTVNASTGAVLHHRPTGKVSTRPMSDVFNTTLFEYIMGAGVNPAVTAGTKPGERTGDFPDVAFRVEQYPRVVDMGLKWPLTNMVGFAAGLNTGPLDDLHDPEKLQALFQKTHQVLFTSAFSSLTTAMDPAQISTTLPGTMSDRPAAIVLVRSIAIIVEVAFAVIAILAGAFWLTTSRRISNMKVDPASISEVMALIPGGNTLSEDIYDDGKVTAVPFEHVIEHKFYRLRLGRRLPSTIEPVQSRHGPLLSHSDTKSFKSGEFTVISAVRPIEHRIWFGVSFGGVIFIAAGALIFLQKWSSMNDGITIPSENLIVRSIMMNYAPTAFATFLEPMWLILSRLLCLLKPYEVLRLGGAKVSQSIGLKYTSIPPQLAIWRALRAKHILLATVCFITVSTNFLAVFLAGLLNEGLTTDVVTYEGSQKWLQAFKNTTSILRGGAPIENRDHFYVALSRYGLKNTLPPWLSDKYYFIPFDIKIPEVAPLTVDGNVTYIYQSSTNGITTRPRCAGLEDAATNPDGRDTITFSTDDDASKVEFFTTHLLQNGTRVKCKSTLGSVDFDKPSTLYNITSPPGVAAQAMEVVQNMESELGAFVNGTRRIDSDCEERLVLGYARVAPASPGESKRSVSKAFIGCSPIVEYARFNVTVDSKGRVLAANRTSEFVSDPEAIFITKNASSTELFRQMGESISRKLIDLNWHNVTYSNDWINHFIKLRSQNAAPGFLAPSGNFTNLLDPNSPLPNVTALATAIDEVYTLLFATIISLNTNFLLAKPPSPISVTVEVSAQVTKLFVSNIMYILSLSLLLAHFCTAVAYYVFRPARFLTRMPTSIASVIAYVSSSRALDDFVPGSESRGDADGKEQRYGYGRFIGRDGKTHIGIERMRYVIPLEAENPHVEKTGWMNALRWRGKRGDGEIRNWI